MSRPLHQAALAIVIALAIVGSAPAQDGKGEPFELVRSLQSLQDQIARETDFAGRRQSSQCAGKPIAVTTEEAARRAR